MDPLAAVLRGAGLTALSPDEASSPEAWPDQPGVRNTRQGLTYYLRDHPQGFVQTYDPREDALSGPVSLLTHSLDIIAPTRAAAGELATRVLDILCSSPWREPGRCEFVSRTHERLDATTHRLTLTLTEVSTWH